MKYNVVQRVVLARDMTIEASSKEEAKELAKKQTMRECPDVDDIETYSVDEIKSVPDSPKPINGGWTQGYMNTDSMK